MNIRRRGLLALVIGLSGLGVSAQEGHPLTGTWAGDWGGADAARRTHLTVVMNWDGKAITGLINPGPAAIPLRTVRVNWANWTVRIDASAPDPSGTPLPIVAEGRLEDIGSARRRIVGTWTQGDMVGQFRLTRE
jgi:hypothetical protein